MPNIRLNVIVVGGGIGGLTSALALRRQGHAVTIVECSAWLREAGAAVTVAPNCYRVLTELGIDTKRDAKGALLRTSKQYHYTCNDETPKFGPTGDGQNVFWADTLKEINLADQFYLVHRVDLHDALKNKCLDKNGPGEPVKILLSSKVVAWDIAGTIKLSDGSHMSGDLVVAADGIRSEAHESILGHRVPAIASGLDNMRFIVSTDDILSDPVTAPLMDDGPGCFVFYVDADRKRHMLRFSCHDDELQNFGAYAWTGKTDSLIGEEVTRAELLERLGTLPPLFQAMANKANKIYRWKIGDRTPISSYTKGRLVLVGDAAHPMYPRQGQGSAQSIEDAGTLGALMSHLQDKSDVPARLKLYDQQRIGRTSIVQRFSRFSYVSAEKKKDTASSEATLPKEVTDLFREFSDGPIPASSVEMMTWLWGHDCLKEAQALLSLARSRKAQTLVSSKWAKESQPPRMSL